MRNRRTRLSCLEKLEQHTVFAVAFPADANVVDVASLYGAIPSDGVDDSLFLARESGDDRARTSTGACTEVAADRRASAAQAATLVSIAGNRLAEQPLEYQKITTLPQIKPGPITRDLSLSTALSSPTNRKQIQCITKRSVVPRLSSACASFHS